MTAVRADLARELEEDVLERAVERLDLGDAAFPEPADDPADQGLGSRRAGGEADALDTVEPGLVDLALVVDQVGVHATGAGHVDEPVRVRAVAGADHEQEVDGCEDPLHGALPVRRRVADVVLLGRLDGRETAAEDTDDLVGVVHGKRRLRQVDELVGLGWDHGLRLLGGLDEEGRLRRLAGRSVDLLVARVADEEDRVAEPCEVPCLGVHLGDERTGGVDRAEPAEARAVAHRRRDAVRREDDVAPPRHLPDVVDEHGSAPLEVADDVRVVDDLLADVDRRPVQLEGPLHGLDCPLDAGAIAPWRGEDQPLDHRLPV